MADVTNHPAATTPPGLLKGKMMTAANKQKKLWVWGWIDEDFRTPDVVKYWLVVEPGDELELLDGEICGDVYLPRVGRWFTTFAGCKKTMLQHLEFDRWHFRKMVRQCHKIKKDDVTAVGDD